MTSGISYAYLIASENTWSSHEMCWFFGTLVQATFVQTQILRRTVTRENEFYVGPPTPCLDITDQECWYWQFVVRSFRLNELREWEKVGCFCPLLQDATFLRGQQGHTVNITPDGRPPPFTNPSLPLSLLYEAGYLVHRGWQIRCKVTLNT